MGKVTDIAYCDSTVNEIVGCRGCELHSKAAPEKSLCYAAALCGRYAGVNKGWPKSFDEPEHFPGRIEKALRWSDLTGTTRSEKPWLSSYPRIIFVNDLSDGFNSIDPEIWLTPHVVDMANSRHIWLFCTKRPDVMCDYFHDGRPVPSNFWLMTTVTSQATTWRVEALKEIPAKHRLLSLEPLLSKVNLQWRLLVGIDGVFIGGASGPKAPPCDLAWIRQAVNDCREAGVKAFVKQLGARPIGSLLPDLSPPQPMLVKDPKGGDPAEWPRDIRVRQMPEVARG